MNDFIKAFYTHKEAEEFIENEKKIQKGFDLRDNYVIEDIFKYIKENKQIVKEDNNKLKEIPRHYMAGLVSDDNIDWDKKRRKYKKDRKDGKFE